ncbi:hypothetical protein P154DRAFT_417912, partial [Amniculicola lignicola CBS 123094]
MEPSLTTFNAVLNPTAAFKDYNVADHLPNTTCWDNSWLNPKNRVDSYEAEDRGQWHLDGIDIDCTRFFIVPTFAICKPPMRIDIFLADHTDLKSLPYAFAPFSPARLSPVQINNVPVRNHILRALNYWSAKQLEFEPDYWRMPFGSRIVIENLCADFRSVSIQTVSDYQIEQSWFSIRALQQKWQFAVHLWPQTINIDQLQFVHQYHECITLVRIPSRHEHQLLVFKSLTRDIKHMYQELMNLIGTESHPNLIGRPLYIVEKSCRFGGKRGVCGFILEYFPLGNLRAALSQNCVGGVPLTLKDQFRLAREVTAALIHVNSQPLGFYPDLKPDNIMLVHRASEVHATLIDLEQRGGWYSWSPPEVYYLEYIEQICSSGLSDHVTERYRNLLRDLSHSRMPNGIFSRHHSSYQGYSIPWLSLPPAQRERAQVFMLGKLLWCIFERRGSINCSLGFDTFREDAGVLGFPHFQQCPLELRDCIRACTAGAPEWQGRFRPLKMEGGLLVLTERNREDQIERTDRGVILREAKRWWQKEMKDAEMVL